MKKFLLLALAMSLHGMGSCSMAFAQETVAVEVKEAAVAPAAVAPAPSPEAALAAVKADEEKAKKQAEAEALITAEEEKQVAEVTEPPAWLKAAIAFALKVPYVGPILVQVLQWMGVLAALLTALAGLMLALAKLLAKFGGNVKFLLKIKQGIDKAYPWIAWLSMFNVGDKKVAMNEEKKEQKTA